MIKEYKDNLSINYIGWNRKDAIEKVSENFLKNLKHKVKFKIIKLSVGPKNKFLWIFIIFFNFFRLIKFYFEKRIIHFEEPKHMELFVNLLFSYKKSMLTVHHLENKNSILNWFFLKEKLKHCSFSRLIAISDKTKRDLIEQYNINSKKITVAYLGVDKKIFKPTNKKIKFLKDKKYILYLGSEIPRKNIENILKAFKEISKKYPDLYLIKAGYSGGDKYRENTKRLIKELGLTKKIIIVSKRLKEEELPIYYSNAELFVYPTLQEGFGMPLVEAMACGCPVVTSNIDPMKEIVKNQVLVNPYEYKDIAKGINKILSNKSYKEELIKRALERAKDFDWDKFANKILKVYKDLGKTK